jgi:hypothetical protein
VRDDQPGQLAERVNYGALRPGALSRERKQARQPHHLRRESPLPLTATARHFPGSFTPSVFGPRILREIAKAGRSGAPKVRP